MLPRALHRILAPLLGVLAASAFANAEVESSQRVDGDTGLVSWFWRDGVIAFSTEQRLPDQTRAFFLARGLPPNASNTIALNCVFQVEVRNVAPSGGPTVELRIDEWRVSWAHEETAPILAADWARRFEGDGLNKSASIALRWSLFPADQSFNPADYNWGMVSYGPAPGESFDLILRWREGEVARETMLKGLRCADDR